MSLSVELSDALTNFIFSIFPPGLIHAVYTAEDSICAGGHFLYPAVMDQAITMLKTLEVKPYLTNDNIPVDIFKVIFGFTHNLLRHDPYEMSSQQLASYLRALEVYDEASTADTSCQDEDHVKRKEIFISRLKQENMLKRLSKLLECKMHPDALQSAGSGDEGGLKRKRQATPDSVSKRSVQSGDRESGHHMNSVYTGISHEAIVIEEATQEDEVPTEVESQTLQGPTAKPKVVVQESENGK